LSKTGIIFSTLLLVSSTVNADFFSDAFDWAIDNPEWSVPIGIIGAPIALATLPMVVSYALFPLASGIGYLMPETTEGLSTAVARGSLSEIGASTRYAGSMLTEAEAEAQRAEYLEHVAMNKNMASEITKLLLTPLN
jgi:hypothetical protein